MNVSTAEVLTEESTRDFFVPTIVSTEPVQKKELDLTFVRFTQRKHAAVSYIKSVESRKRNHSRIKETIGNIAGAIGIFAMIYGMCIIGAFF